VLVTWIVFDSSASMAFGTADRRKADVAEGVALAVGHLATRRGNRLGVVTFGTGAPRPRSPHEGRRGLLFALEALRDAPAGGEGLRDALELVGALAVQRSLVVVISDFRGPRDWQNPLLRLAARHPVLAVEIADPREQELEDIGDIVVADPETGRQVLVDTSDPLVREHFARAAAEERQSLVASLLGAGVHHVALSTEGDWFRPLAMFLKRSDRR
jgi:uncharacterized protein (DUF58 family)